MVSCLGGRNHFCASPQVRLRSGISCFYLDAFILNFFFGEVFSLLFHLRIYFIQVVVQVLKNHIQFFRYEQYLFQLYDVAVIEFPQRFYFS